MHSHALLQNSSVYEKRQILFYKTQGNTHTYFTYIYIHVYIYYIVEDLEMTDRSVDRQRQQIGKHDQIMSLQYSAERDGTA